MKKITIMVYMAADNNLDLFSSQDMNEMMKIGSSESVNIITEVDRRRAFLSESNIDNFGTKRFFIEKGGFKEIQDLGETNTGDFVTLKNFIEWGMENYPAQIYFLTIWNHGGGVKDEDIYARFGRKMKRPLFGKLIEGQEVRWVASDDTSRDFLDMCELKKALEVPNRISIIGFDACLMSCFEVMYQLKETADCMIASQEIEPLDGWNYANAFNGIDTLVTSIEIFAKQFIDSYIETYLSTDKNVTLSALNIRNAEYLGLKISELASILLNNFSDYQLGILKISRIVHRFRDKDYIDLFDFAYLCAKHLAGEEIQNAATSLIKSIKSTVIKNGTKGIDKAHGLSILFPAQSMKEDVKNRYLTLSYTKTYPAWIQLIEKLDGP